MTFSKGGSNMFSIKHFSQVWKIIMGLFLITNLILSFDFTSNPYLLRYINLYAISSFAFADSSSAWEFIITFIILILEIIFIRSLFIKKNKYKLICNILFQLICIADICFCIYFMIEQIEPTICIIEVIIDLIFIGLILFNIIITYKKPKNNTETLPQ